MSQKTKILLTGGGTGGHIYPALALYRQIKADYPQAEFLYIGTDKGLEARIVPEAGIPFKSIDIQGFRRSLSLSNLTTIRKFLASYRKSSQYIKDFQPDIVLGTGGYVCGPVIYAASRLKLPTIIHEQNSLVGVTNKFLAPYVTKIAVCFEDALDQFNKYQNKVVLTGNPRAQEVVQVEKEDALADYGLDPNLPTLLIFGGSRGALKINETVLQGLEELENKDYQTIFVSGQDYYEKIQEDIELSSLKNVKILPYISNMPQVFKEIDLVVCRSGATSLAELTALGLPSILIPSPNVTDDHQTKNALSLVKQGAATMIRESDLSSESLLSRIDQLMDNEGKRLEMSAASKEMGIPDASDRLIHLMQEII